MKSRQTTLTFEAEEKVKTQLSLISMQSKGTHTSVLNSQGKVKHIQY